MDLDLLPVGAGAIAGLASLAHCVAMCGPLAALAAGDGTARASRIARHQLGRALAYAALGAMAGALGAGVARALLPPGATMAMAVLLAIAMVAAGVRILREPARPRATVEIGRGPRRLPLAARLLARAPREPALLGAISALLPCGALHGVLFVAALSGSAAVGAATMVAFAVASGGGLAIAGWLGTQALASPRARRALGAALIVGALIVLARPLVAPASCHVAARPTATAGIGAFARSA